MRSLVALHGGEVRAHSEGAHRGSCFTVTLPRVAMPAHVDPPAAPASAPTGARPRLRLLIVDDNQDAARTLAELLDALGHAPRVAYSAAEALAPADVAFDACVLDIGLPDMTGYELAAALRAQGHDRATYIALTGYGQAHDRVLSKAAGFDHHLVKPVDLDRLLDVLAGVAPDACAEPDALAR